MKKLVLYYSFGGNTRLIAETVARATDADIEELKPAKPLNAGGVGYVAWGLRQLVSQSKPPLLRLKHDPCEYDLIVIGTPVWSYTMTPPVRTFLEEYRFEGKNVALFCCHGGNYGKTFEDMKDKLHGNTVASTADFCNPLKNDPDENCRKAAAWASGLY